MLEACATQAPLTIYVPIRLSSLANERLHWSRKAKIVAAQRLAVKVCLMGHTLPPLPVQVTFTRIGKKKCDDDNLAYLFKGVRDQVAQEFGVDDGSPLWTWRYSQEIGKEYGVEIEITTKGA